MNQPLRRVSLTQRINKTAELERKKANLEKLHQRNIRQEAIERNFQTWCESGFNALRIRKEFKTLKKIKEKTSEKSKEKQNTEKIEKVNVVDNRATKYKNQNSELDKRSLILLRENISEKDDFKSILQKTLQFYPDPSLADEALDFLIETTTQDLQKEVQKAKDLLHKTFKREIIAGKNIQIQAQTYAKQGLGTPTSLRDLYRDITGNIRTPQTLFEDLLQHFEFKEMEKIIKFIFHSVGMDLRSKGPSIDPNQLMKLLDDTKNLQAILGLFNFFLARMDLIKTLFKKKDIPINPLINFEKLSKEFLHLISQRYVSLDKILALANKFDISEQKLAQIIIFYQMLDALRNTSFKLYKSQKQRQELLEAFLEAIEEVEEEE